jgi:transposase-like protein
VTQPIHRADAPGTLWVKRKGMGTIHTDRPPIISLVSRQTGEYRYWVCDRASKALCHEIIHENVPPHSTILYTDGLASYVGALAEHHTVNHSIHEWARDDNGDGIREVHCNTCEGAGAALRTALRVFRGVHKDNLHLYVVTFETMTNAKRITPQVIHRMCMGDPSLHTKLS